MSKVKHRQNNKLKFIFIYVQVPQPNLTLEQARDRAFFS